MAVDIEALCAAISDLSPEAQERVQTVVLQEQNLTAQAVEWRKTAHECDKKHDLNEQDKESAEADDKIAEIAGCHDCGRGMIADVGTEHVLVCPKLHGRRPPELTGVVECGQPGA